MVLLTYMISFWDVPIVLLCAGDRNPRFCHFDSGSLSGCNPDVTLHASWGLLIRIPMYLERIYTIMRIHI